MNHTDPNLRRTCASICSTLQHTATFSAPHCNIWMYLCGHLFVLLKYIYWWLHITDPYSRWKCVFVYVCIHLYCQKSIMMIMWIHIRGEKVYLCMCAFFLYMIEQYRSLFVVNRCRYLYVCIYVCIQNCIRKMMCEAHSWGTGVFTYVYVCVYFFIYLWEWICK